MFITAKVEEEEGSIFQIVVVSFTDNDLETYKSTVYPLAEQVVGWIYNIDVIKRGYLRDEDIPPFLRPDYLRVNIMKSRCKLLYAHLNKMMIGGESTPTTPIHLYKHHVQTRYNSGKPG